MALSNGNPFRITGQSWLDSIGYCDRLIYLAKAQWYRAIMFWRFSLTNISKKGNKNNSRVTGGLRRHDAIIKSPCSPHAKF